MKEKIKGLVKKSLRFVPLSVFKELFPMELTGFFYHAVTNGEMLHVKNLYPPVSAEDFEATLVALKKRYTFVSYADLVAAFEGKAYLPKKAAHLSFDDGFVENYTVVMPILQKLEIPCMFFLTSEWIDNQALFYRSKVSLCVEKVNTMNEAALNASIETIGDDGVTDKDSLLRKVMRFKQEDEDEVSRYCAALGVDTDAYLKEAQPFLSTVQIQEMYAAGFTFGGHSVSHRKFVQLPVERVEAEIVDSCKKIQEITGQKEVPFAFPNSATGFDRKLLTEIREKNVVLGLIFNSKGLLPDEPYLFNRIWMERKLKNGKRTWQAYLKDAYEGFVWDKILNWRR